MDVFSQLTDREQQVLTLLAQGRPNHEIAIMLEPRITIRSVERHVTQIFKKLGVRNRTQAAHIFWQIQQGPDEGRLSTLGSVMAREFNKAEFIGVPAAR